MAQEMTVTQDTEQAARAAVQRTGQALGLVQPPA